MEKPNYIPSQIWHAAVYMLDAWDEDDIKFARDISASLRRLLFDGPHQDYANNLEKTWKRIVADLDEHDRSLDYEDQGQTYRILLDTLAVTPKSIDPGMRPALDDGAKKLERIAGLARELSRELTELTAIREQKGIEWDGGSEFELITQWVEASGCDIVRQHWKNSPGLTDLLDQLGDAAEFQPLRPPLHYEYAEVGDGGVTGTHDVSALVRHFDARIAEKCYFPAGFNIGNTDLARLLSALLQRPVSSQAVISARKVNLIVNQDE